MRIKDARGLLWLLPGALVLLSRGIRPLSNPDIYWHLSAGLDILYSGAFPRRETLSHTLYGHSWTDFEWLAQFIYACAFKLAGFLGLIALKTLILCVLAYLVDRRLAYLRIAKPGRGFALLLLACGLTAHSFVRPENFTLPLFAGLLAYLEKKQNTDFKSPLRAALALLALFALWANLHGGFIFGLGLLFAYLLAACFKKNNNAARAYAYWSAAGLIGTFLNPYGADVYSVILQHAQESTLLQTAISEWSPAAFNNAYLLPFWASSAAALFFIFSSPKNRPTISTLLILCGLFYATLRHARNSPFFTLSVILLTAGPLHRAWQSATPKRRRAGSVCAGIAACLLGVYVWNFSPWHIPRRAIARHSVPEGSARFLLENAVGIKGVRLYNPWGWGGYLGWRLRPRYKIFFDGRYLFHPLLFSRIAVTKDPFKFQEFLNHHGAQIILLKRQRPPITVPIPGAKGKDGNEPRPYYLFFMPRDKWALVYFDPTSLIFVDRKVAEAAWLAEHEFRFFRPDDARALLRAVSQSPFAQDGVVREICRHRRLYGGASGADVLNPIGADCPSPQRLTDPS